MSDAKKVTRIGLFGGTFNPIHLGHLRAAEEVREALGLEQVLFIPSRIPPHKRPDPNDPIAPTIAPAAERLEWVERAIADHEAFSVDRIEIDREGPSFLVDTLEAIRKREALRTTDALRDTVALGESEDRRRSTVFIVGEDAFAEMGDWRKPEAIFALTDLAVMTRPPGALKDLEMRIPKVVHDAFEFESGGTRARHKEAGTTVELVTISALEISSSTIRERCRTGRSIRFLVPETIRGAIEQSGRYAPGKNDRNGTGIVQDTTSRARRENERR